MKKTSGTHQTRFVCHVCRVLASVSLWQPLPLANSFGHSPPLIHCSNADSVNHARVSREEGKNTQFNNPPVPFPSSYITCVVGQPGRSDPPLFYIFLENLFSTFCCARRIFACYGKSSSVSLLCFLGLLLLLFIQESGVSTSQRFGGKD